MVATLRPGTVEPNKFTQLVRWLEAALTQLHAWRVSAARAGANLALWFVMSWYPGLSLDKLAAQRADVET